MKKYHFYFFFFPENTFFFKKVRVNRNDAHSFLTYYGFLWKTCLFRFETHGKSIGMYITIKELSIHIHIPAKTSLG